MPGQSPSDVIKPEVRQLSAYTLKHVKADVKLDQNENPYELPQELKEEVARRVLARPWGRYPEFVPHSTTQALAKFTGWREDGILIGNGSNELIMAGLSVVLGKGRKAVIPQPTFTLYRLLSSVFEAQVTTVPLYLMWVGYGLTGSLWPLVLPMLFGDAFSIFLLRQFLVTIPGEYLDAARVDGCGEWRTLLRIVIPVARPGIAAAAMFQFFYCWNDYYGPLLYTSENEGSWTLSLGLASFRSLHHVDWNLATAATMLTLLPVVVLFFFAQKAFVQGVTLTGVKG